jgi:hypothetical protein
MEEKMYFPKTGISIGLLQGLSVSVYRGAAYDDFGVTHFTAYNVAKPSNLENNQKPDLDTGAGGYLGGIGGSIDTKASTFKEAFEKWGFSVGAGGGVVLGAGYTATNENSIDGINAEIGFGGFGASVGMNGGGNTNYLQSISVSYNEAKSIGVWNGATKQWSVEDIKPIYDKKGKISGFSGTVFSSNVGLSGTYENT